MDLRIALMVILIIKSVEPRRSKLFSFILKLMNKVNDLIETKIFIKSFLNIFNIKRKFQIY